MPTLMNFAVDLDPGLVALMILAAALIVLMPLVGLCIHGQVVSARLEEKNAALAASEGRFRTLFALLSDFYWELDADLRLCRVEGRRMEKLKPLIGLHPWELPGLDTTAPPWPDHADTLRAHLPYDEVEYSVVDGDGRRLWISVTGRPLFDGAGRFLGYHGVSRNITARKSEEEARQRSERRLRYALDAAQDGIFEHQIAQQHFYASPACARMLGYAAEEFTDSIEQWDERVHPDDRHQLVEIRERVTAGLDFFEYETRRRAKDGTYRWIQTRARVVERGPRGEPMLVGNVRDVTERRSVEEALKLGEERLRLAFEVAQDGFMDRDLEAGTVYFSPSCFRMLGYEAGELPETLEAWDALCHPDDVGSIRRLRRYELGSQAQLENEVRRRARDGSWRWLSARGRVVAHGADGGPRRVVVSFRDVTDSHEREAALRQAMAAAEQANRAKSEFLATMSHEIRTPMNGVLGMTDLLLETDLSDRQRQFATTAHRSGEGLLAVINDILDLSKIEAGGLELESIAFDAGECVEDVAELLAERAHRKGLELCCRIDESVPARVVGDPGRLRQILTNLISNAVKFTEAGEVCVTVRSAAGAPGDGAQGALCAGADARLLFEVADSGIGIAAEVRQRLFLPFSQADSSTTRKYGGTGLGLAISRQLVEAMGGEIDVESAPGRGSVFRFTARLPAAGQARAGGADLAGLRALVVDDSAIARSTLAGCLRARGVRVETAADAAEALSRLRAVDPSAHWDVVLVDADMPGAAGDVAAAARAGARGAAPRLVMLTSLTPTSAAGGGRFDCLSKPVRRAGLERLLRGFVAPLEPAAGARRADAAPPALRGRVLLAEDNLVNIKVAVSMLEQLGYAASVVTNGREAVAAAARERFDLILMDCQMPVMDGFDASLAIRAAELSAGLSRVPIVALTANAVRGDRERCIAAGMDDYLAKPFRKGQLGRMLELHHAGADSPAAENLFTTGAEPEA